MKQILLHHEINSKNINILKPGKIEKRYQTFDQIISNIKLTINYIRELFLGELG